MTREIDQFVAPKYLLHSVVPARVRGAEGFWALTSLTLPSTPHTAAPWLKPICPSRYPSPSSPAARSHPPAFFNLTETRWSTFQPLWLASFHIQPMPHGPALLLKPRKICQAEPCFPQHASWFLYKWTERGQAFGNECLQTFLVATPREGGFSWCLEARDVIKHPTMHKPTPTTKNYLAQCVRVWIYNNLRMKGLFKSKLPKLRDAAVRCRCKAPPSSQMRVNFTE